MANPKKRKTKIYRWGVEEILAVLNFFKTRKSSLLSGKSMVVHDVYNKLLEELLPDCSLTQLRRKIASLKVNYVSTCKWISQKTNEEEILRRCPFFYHLNEVYGTSLTENNSEEIQDLNQSTTSNTIFDSEMEKIELMYKELKSEREKWRKERIKRKNNLVYQQKKLDKQFRKAKLEIEKKMVDEVSRLNK